MSCRGSMSPPPSLEVKVATAVVAVFGIGAVVVTVAMVERAGTAEPVLMIPAKKAVKATLESMMMSFRMVVVVLVGLLNVCCFVALM